LKHRQDWQFESDWFAIAVLLLSEAKRAMPDALATEQDDIRAALAGV
jgi:hypothetical protein